MKGDRISNNGSLCNSLLYYLCLPICAFSTKYMRTSKIFAQYMLIRIQLIFRFYYTCRFLPKWNFKSATKSWERMRWNLENFYCRTLSSGQVMTVAILKSEQLWLLTWDLKVLRLLKCLHRRWERVYKVNNAAQRTNHKWSMQ